jgi:arsenate reductase (thioredoxin)
MRRAPYHCLFLCTGNSARSIMAEAILMHYGNGKFQAYSAGSQPLGQVNPHALALLLRLGIPIRGLRSKSWQEFSGPTAPPLDFVFTVCDRAAAETCPIWPGQPLTAHWGVADPAAVAGNDLEITNAFREAYRILEARIQLFINLPIDALDSLRLERAVRDIGTTQ